MQLKFLEIPHTGNLRENRLLGGDTSLTIKWSVSSQRQYHSRQSGSGSTPARFAKRRLTYSNSQLTGISRLHDLSPWPLRAGVDNDTAVGTHPLLSYQFPLLPQRSMLLTEHFLALEEDATSQAGTGKVEVSRTGAAAASHGGTITLTTITPLQKKTANKKENITQCMFLSQGGREGGQWGGEGSHSPVSILG